MSWLWLLSVESSLLDYFCMDVSLSSITIRTIYFCFPLIQLLFYFLNYLPSWFHFKDLSASSLSPCQLCCSLPGQHSHLQWWLLVMIFWLHHLYNPIHILCLYWIYTRVLPPSLLLFLFCFHHHLLIFFVRCFFNPVINLQFPHTPDI